MTISLLAFPVLPGKSDADVRTSAEEFKSRSREYEQSRRRLGVTLERAYLQHTPMGSCVVAYIEAERPFVEGTADLATSEYDLDKDFVRFTREVHGFDMTKPTEGPPPETVAEWLDPKVRERRRGLAFVVPLIPDAVERAKSELRRHYASPEFTASRRRLQQNREVAGLLHTPQGPLGVVYLEGFDPRLADRALASSQAPYDLEFKRMLTTICPPSVDFSKPLQGIEEIFDSMTVASLGRLRKAA